MRKITLLVLLLCLISFSAWSQILTVQYKCAETNRITNQIKPYFNIINKGDETIDLSDVYIRYYYTSEGSVGDQATVDYSVMDSSVIKLTLYSSHLYMDLGFTGGTLAPGKETGKIQLRINKSDWSVFDQSNDNSFDPGATEYGPNPDIDVFYQDTQVPGSQYSLTIKGSLGAYYEVLPDDKIYDSYKAVVLEYDEPTEVTIIAHYNQPTDYYCQFKGWTGDFTASTEEISIMVDDQYYIEAEISCINIRTPTPSPAPTPGDQVTPPPVILSPSLYEISYPETQGAFTIVTSYGPLSVLDAPDWVSFSSSMNFTVDWSQFAAGETKTGEVAFHDYLSNGLGYASIRASYKTGSPDPERPWPAEIVALDRMPIFSALNPTVTVGYLQSMGMPVSGAEVQWRINTASGISAASGTIKTGSDGSIRPTIKVLLDGCIDQKDTMELTYAGDSLYAPANASISIRIFSNCMEEAHVYFNPSVMKVPKDTAFDVTLEIETNSSVAAYGFAISYNSDLLKLNADLGDSGVDAGSDGYIAAVNIEKSGEIVISGFDVRGTNPGVLDFLNLYFYSGSEPGASELKITVDNLSNAQAESINVEIFPGSVVIGSMMLGDVNSDHSIDVIDALLCAQYYVGIEVKAFTEAAGDVDCDGLLTIVDALLIAQYYVKIIDSFC